MEFHSRVRYIDVFNEGGVGILEGIDDPLWNKTIHAPFP